MTARSPQARPGTLEDLLVRQGTLGPAEALALFRPLLGQVRALHTAGRLHGAIRPENVLLEGQPRLTEPATSVALGTDAATCPPELAGLGPVSTQTIEQAATALKDRGLGVDPRLIDVYQLAALLVRLCTGKPVAQFLRSPLAGGSLPPAWRPTIDRALAFVPDGRPSDAERLLAELEAIDSQPERTGDPSSTTGWHGAADTPATGETALPFDRLGPYRIVGLLGRGGMGEVYLGLEEGLNRSVAIKVLRPGLARLPGLVQRFHNEASALARIDHPNLVPVYFSGQDQGTHFFAMRYVQGETLEQRLARSGRLESDETLTILERCLEGLEVAHQARLIHRDIKPGNILLEEGSGRVWLADFGLVKDLEASQGLTSSGASIGTASYMAPEQARGKAVDARADLYSLGVVAYRMLSGRLPFEADSLPAMLFQHAYSEPLPLPEVAPNIVRLVEGMMARRPADRYACCADVLADLRRLRRGEPLAGPSPAPALQLVRLPELDRLPAAMPTPPRLAWSIRLGAWLRLLPAWEAESLGTTTQQVDDLVDRYQRRRDELAGLIAQAEELAEDLTTQAAGFRLAAEAAARRAAEEQRQRAEDQAVALERDASEQRQVLESLRQELTGVEQGMDRLVHQRDVLAQRRQRLRPIRRTRPRRIRVAVGGSLLLTGAAGLLLLVLLPLWRPSPAPPNPITPGEEDYRLGLAALYGRGRPHDGVAAFTSFRKASEAGHQLATAHLALCYAHGEGVKEDAKRGQALLALALGAVHEAAASDDPEAATLLGRLYQSGVGVKVDHKEAVRWYHVAAKQGHPQAQDNLAAMHEHGLGVPKDEKLAFYWFHEAAKKGLVQTQNHLGGMYATGRGVKKDEKEACEWYRRSAEQNNSHAQNNLAGMYLTGRGVKKDEKEASRWFEKSAKQGFAPGQANLGGMYEEGRGVAKDEEGAFLWYHLAAKQGHAAAQYKAGEMYAQGRGVRRDVEEAVRWLNKAAQQKYPSGGPDAWVGPERTAYSLAPGRPQHRVIHRVRFTPDGQHVLFAFLWPPTGVPCAWLFDLKSGKGVRRFGPSAQHIPSLAWSDDGQFALIGTGGAKEVEVFEVSTGQRVRLLGKHPKGVQGVAFSPDGKRAVTTCHDRFVRLWDLATGQEILQFDSKEVVLKPRFSPDGMRLLGFGQVGRYGALRLWDLQTGKLLRELAPFQKDVGDAVFTPDGKHVLVGGAVTRLLDVETGEEVRRFGEGWGWGVALSPDGQRFACWGPAERGTVFFRLCDIKTGREVARFIGHEKDIRGLAFSPDGQRIVTSGLDGTLRLWGVPDIHPEYLIESALHNGMVLDVKDAQAKDYAPVQLAGPGDQRNRRWRLISLGNDQYLIESALKKGMVLDVKDARAEKGARIQLGGAVDGYHLQGDQPGGQGANRRWKLIPTGGDGEYLIESALKEGLVLEVEDGKGENFSPIQVGKVGKEAKQRWRLVRRPRQSDADFNRSEWYARHVRWRDAASDLAEAVRLAPQDDWRACLLITWLSYLGDKEAHQRQREQWLAQFGRSPHLMVVMHGLVWLHLMPDGGGDPQVLLQMADRCLVGTEKHNFQYCWMVMGKGMAEYRAGHFTQAIEWLRKAEPLLRDDCWKAGASFFLAMALHRLNQAEEARAARRQALRYMEQEFGTVDRRQPKKGQWYVWPWCQLVRREAEALLGEK